ncbi:MAG TPA: VWA domain-containing protein [Myxococcales bacterium]|nr:VWA domain-containing protein [Myxococcales bacterium]HIK86172.1 VWA domain-containing protein [Myxococcales bacterium]
MRISSGSKWMINFFLAALFASGCAKPVPYVTNVIVDVDVRGCSPETVGPIGGMDVAIIIDTSQSTRRPSGIDVNRDGKIPAFRGNSTAERGDSRLAAQIAALRPLVQSAAGRDIRFSVVTYSGASGVRTTGKSANSGTSSETRTRAKLTKDTLHLNRVFDEVLSRGSNGTTVFFAGMQQGARSLLASRVGGRRRIALFLSDDSRPTSIVADTSLLPGNPAVRSAADPRMKKVAILARQQKIVFHTFGLSPNSRTWRHHALGQIAGATGGNFHAVEDANSFYCHLAAALSPANSTSTIERAFARAGRSTTVAVID